MNVTNATNVTKEMFHLKGRFVASFADIGIDDIPAAGGKNASLGELTRHLADAGVRVPEGFAVLVDGYRELLKQGRLRQQIEDEIAKYRNRGESLGDAGRHIRSVIRGAPVPEPVAAEIRSAYRELASACGIPEVAVAVRSSATAEDLPNASFAGQQETFLNVAGEDDVVEACSLCYASLFTDRAIKYRDDQGFDQMQVGLSIGIQRMVRSDIGGAGVLFTIDTESGFDKVVVVNAAWGLGDPVVQGGVNPDEYFVFKKGLENPKLTPIIQRRRGEKATKEVYSRRHHGSRTKVVDTSLDEREHFVLTDAEVLQLARWGVAIENHYGRPMDVEWAKDGRSGDIYIVQARGETVHSRDRGGVLRTFTLKKRGNVLTEGRAIGSGVVSAPICRIETPDQIDQFKPGAILVTAMTDPDWVPIMRSAAGIVTDLGGRTCHAAIVGRELGIPAIVGTENATTVLPDGQQVTLSCAEGETGYVYDGVVEAETHELSLTDLPKTRTQILVNMAVPEGAFAWHALPVQGVGLTRIEFIFTNTIKVHPLALVHFDELKDVEAKEQIERITLGYADKKQYCVDKLAEGVASIAAAFHPHPVIVRMSDFKTNEYANLIGGSAYEPEEDNPMLGFRGASRYYSESYRPGFDLECQAMKKAREVIGLRNIVLMIPFCRTLEEADRVLKVMAENGLVRGEEGLEIYVMAEIPSNVILAKEFAERFDGFSIGSNDLTQLVLGVDRDSAQLSSLFDERNPAVTRMIENLILAARASGRKVGICGQAPSDYPDFAEFLVKAGIDSISLNPDSVVPVLRRVAEVERAIQ